MVKPTTHSNMSHDEIVQAYYDDLRKAELPATVICAILLVIALLGNTLTLYVFKFHYKKGKYRNFVLFITMADLLSCLITIPGQMFSYLCAYPVSYICKLNTFLQEYTLFAKLVCLAIIGVDRYRKIFHPFLWQMRQTTAILSCLGVYMVAPLFVLPVPILWNVNQRDVEYNNINITVTVCGLSKTNEIFKDQHVFIYFIYSISLMALPLLCMLLLYGLVHRKLIIWKKAVFRRSMKKKRDACGTVAELSTDELTARNIRSNQEVYVISDAAQTHVAGEDSNPSNNQRVEEKLNMIYVAKRKATMMIYLAFIYFIITFIHLLCARLESSNSFPPPIFISHVVNHVVFVLLDPEYREGIRQLKRRRAC